ncbi:MAG: AMP-binding protein, partial [Phycisphaerales bacterium]
MAPDTSGIESVLHEQRLFSPPRPRDAGAPRWLIDSWEQFRTMHERSISDPEGFWGDAAGELHWFKKWDRVVDWSPPDARWFSGGRTNLCFNAVDRHVMSGHGGQTAIIWEGEPILEDLDGSGPEIRRLTYTQLRDEVCRFANVLKSLGVKKGDVVTIYMGMVPELAVAVLACARIGAPHSVIFGGFSSQSIVDRVIDAGSKVVVTCDAAWRRGKLVPLKDNVNAACDILADQGHRVDAVVVLDRCGGQGTWAEGRDHDWHEAMAAASSDCPCEPLEAEDMAFMLYTSGSTGKPKGIVHTVGGYMVYTYLTAKYVFNLIPDSGQVYWCTADVGWITGHSYILYGVLPNRVPTLMYEGAPNAPGEDRFWSIVARHRVTQFYTAPTAIRAFMKWGHQHPARHDLSSLQVLGTVGEPINPEAWMWYRQHIGRSVCPIVDTWWQTETGGHMLTPLPGVTPTKPGSCT